MEMAVHIINFAVRGRQSLLDLHMSAHMAGAHDDTLFAQAWHDLAADWPNIAGRQTALVRSEWLEGVTDDPDRQHFGSVCRSRDQGTSRSAHSTNGRHWNRHLCYVEIDWTASIMHSWVTHLN